MILKNFLLKSWCDTKIQLVWLTNKLFQILPTQNWHISLFDFSTTTKKKEFSNLKFQHNLKYLFITSYHPKKNFVSKFKRTYLKIYRRIADSVASFLPQVPKWLFPSHGVATTLWLQKSPCSWTYALQLPKFVKVLPHKKYFCRSEHLASQLPKLDLEYTSLVSTHGRHHLRGTTIEAILTCMSLGPLSYRFEIVSQI